MDYCKAARGLAQQSALPTLPVVLAPRSQLHVGVHGSLINDPPPGIRYIDSRSERCFLLPPGPGPLDPFARLSISESTGVTHAPVPWFIVHSAQLPVHTAVGWVVDSDELLSALECGIPFAVGRGGVGGAKRPVDSQARRQRIRIMLSHYLDPHCTGILLRTEYARRRLFRRLEEAAVTSSECLEQLQARTRVVYPAVRPCAPQSVAELIRILYMGRTRDKGGDLATRIFNQLASSQVHRLELHFVGPVAQHSCLHPAVRHYDVMGRSDYLQLLSRCHIFFSPTEFEGFGWLSLRRPQGA